MPAKKKPGDLFMNFKVIESATGADSSALTEQAVSTGLSIRGALIWLIHSVEFYFDSHFTSNFTEMRVALSTRGGLAAIPTIADHGVIAAKKFLLYHVGGSVLQVFPTVQSFLPPIPLAAPNLSLYVKGAANHADGQSKDFDCRINFTTAPLDAAAYTEISEAWGW